jgi:ATP-dependent Lon protease
MVRVAGAILQKDGQDTGRAAAMAETCQIDTDNPENTDLNRKRMGTDMTDQAANAVPVLPLRDVVVYPHMVIPLFVGREKSINALDTAMQEDKKILLVAQKNAEIDDPSVDDIHRIGTLSTILQLLKLPDGTVKVLVEGAERVRVTAYDDTDAFFTAHIESLSQQQDEDIKELDVLKRSLLAMFEQYVKLNKKVPPEILTSLSGIEEPGRLADTIAAHMSLKLEEKQKILEIISSHTRLERLMVLIEGEIDIMQIEKRIRGRVKQQMEKSQREYYLNEQMKAIQKEIGDMDDVPSELDELEQKIEKAGMSKEAKEKATSELNKLKMMSPMSAEATVVIPGGAAACQETERANSVSGWPPRGRQNLPGTFNRPCDRAQVHTHVTGWYP